MSSILGWLTIILVAAVFLGLPVYLLYLTFSAKKVDQQIKKEVADMRNTNRR
jgi:sensor histidine kinase YesM